MVLFRAPEWLAGPKKDHFWDKFFQGSICEISFLKGPNCEKNPKVSSARILTVFPKFYLKNKTAGHIIHPE